MKDAIILFSHGSLLCGAGENLRQLAERMERRGDAAMVRAGYLNYSEPAFAEVFARCVQEGATRVTIAPYFLVEGFFVKQQLPPQIAAMRARFPRVEVRVAQAMCRHELLADAVLASARRAHPPREWRRILKTAPQFCRDDSRCPLHGGVLCPGTGLRAPGSARETAGENEINAASSAPAEPRALLVMVHGSPHAASNDDMFAVVDEVRRRSEYSIVEVGFMECNEPDIPTAIERCVAAGTQSLVAMPYFLHTGKHVADDLPTLLEAAQTRHPDVQFLMSDYLGRDPLIADVLRGWVRAAQQ